MDLVKKDGKWIVFFSYSAEAWNKLPPSMTTKILRQVLQKICAREEIDLPPDVVVNITGPDTPKTGVSFVQLDAPSLCLEYVGIDGCLFPWETKIWASPVNLWKSTGERRSVRHIDALYWKACLVAWGDELDEIDRGEIDVHHLTVDMDLFYRYINATHVKVTEMLDETERRNQMTWKMEGLLAERKIGRARQWILWGIFLYAATLCSSAGRKRWEGMMQSYLDALMFLRKEPARKIAPFDDDVDFSGRDFVERWMQIREMK